MHADYGACTPTSAEREFQTQQQVKIYQILCSATVIY